MSEQLILSHRTWPCSFLPENTCPLASHFVNCLLYFLVWEAGNLVSEDSVGQGWGKVRRCGLVDEIRSGEILSLNLVTDTLIYPLLRRVPAWMCPDIKLGQWLLSCGVALTFYSFFCFVLFGKEMLSKYQWVRFSPFPPGNVLKYITQCRAPHFFGPSLFWSCDLGPQSRGYGNVLSS